MQAPEKGWRTEWNEVVLTIEQMGCEWEELREPYRGRDVGFVEYLQHEEIEWAKWVDRGWRRQWGSMNLDLGWDYWETEKGRHQRGEYFNFWESTEDDFSEQ